MRWFRMYWSLVDSVKVGALDDAGFRTYIELLCLAGQKHEKGHTGVTSESVNWRLRRNVTDPLQKLLQANLVTVARNGELTIPDWEEKQKKSDSSAERVAKFRNKNSETDKVTLRKRKSNGLDKNRREEIDIPGFSMFWDSWPAHFRKQSRGSCGAVWRKRGLESRTAEILAHLAAVKDSSQWRDEQFIPAPLVYLNQERWDGAKLAEPKERRVAL